ncbi:MAG: hypothetical protein ABIB11_03055, partial [Candidatus Omnitrophota bacterium]
MDNLKNNIKIFLDKLPYIRTLKKRLDVYESMSNAAFPAGHFYSPLPSKEDLMKNKSLIFNKDNAEFSGLDLNVDEQLQFFDKLKQYYNEAPFEENKGDELRYYYDNSMYKKADGIFLYSFLRYLRPSRIIEIGSGFSSALMLDTNDKFFEGKPALSVSLVYVHLPDSPDHLDWARRFVESYHTYPPGMD